MSRLPNKARWWALAPGVFAAFIAAGIAGGLVANQIGVWRLPVEGFLAAVTVVLTAWAVAPRARLKVATWALLLGAVCAWWLVSPPSFYPEDYGARAYTPTYLPIASTYVGGALAWLFCYRTARRT